jgi:hypothetical protein
MLVDVREADGRHGILGRVDVRRRVPVVLVADISGGVPGGISRRAISLRQLLAYSFAMEGLRKYTRRSQESRRTGGTELIGSTGGGIN